METLESKGLNVNPQKTRVMVSSGVTIDGMSIGKVDPYMVYSLRVKTITVLCVQCGRWIHGRCAGVKRLAPKFFMNFTYRKWEGNIVEAVEQEEKLCDEVETVLEFTYLGDRVSDGGGYEVAMIVRT